ncbi:MAG: cyanophycinase [Myxococcaceae bacterium]
MPASTGSAPAFQISRRLGDPLDSSAAPQGPGLVMMGGGADVDAAFTWMQQKVAGAANTAGGDLVIIRASGTDAYDPYVREVAPLFGSVQTLIVPKDATPKQLRKAAAIVRKAEAVFFAGGDQSDYVSWKGTPLIKAVQGVYDRGGVVGGTSAGLAIQGVDVFDSKRTGNNDLGSDEAVANPTTRRISFTHDFLHFAPLEHAITDTHFEQRNRGERLPVLMARLQENRRGEPSLGIGVNEGTALLVDGDGQGRVVEQHPDRPGGGATLWNDLSFSPLRSGKPFKAKVTVHPLRDGAEFNLNRPEDVPGKRVAIDGSRAGTPEVFSDDPYSL